RSLRLQPPPPLPHPLSLHDALPIWIFCSLECCYFSLFHHLIQFSNFPLTTLIPFLGYNGSQQNCLISRFSRIYPVEARFSSSFPDRKSTRLNSSHVSISYAVFCLNK